MINRVFKKSVITLLAAGTATFAVLTAVHGEKANFVTSAAADTAAAPVLYTVTDGVQSGDGVTLTGAYLYGALTINYTLSGSNETKTIAAKGDDFGTGTTFVFPYGEESGIYEISVKTANGTSQTVSMNAPRLLYIDKDEVYGGQIVNIVGRNMLSSEYGVCDESEAFKRLIVKIEKNGTSYELTQENGGILTGVKTAKEQCVTNKDILYSNPFKTAIRIPEGALSGDYTISVSTDNGATYGTLDNGQKLTIVEKKAQNISAKVFGNDTSSFVGNDPLGIGAAWAQDFDYANVYTVSPNSIEGLEYDDAKAKAQSLRSTVQQQISSFSKDGGGIIYFPEGEYYLTGIELSANVMLIGAGADKTTVYRVNEAGGQFIQAYTYSNGQVGYNNVGIANLTIKESAVSTGYPDHYVLFPQGDAKEKDEYGILRKSSQNKFIIGVNLTIDEDDFTAKRADKNNTGKSQRARVSLNAYKNTVAKDVVISGGTCFSVEGYSYVTVENVKYYGPNKIADTPALQGKFAYVENSYFDLNNSGHGPSVRSDTYTAYTKTVRTGDRDKPTNDGEAFLTEMPEGYFATGTATASSDASVSLIYEGTNKKCDDCTGKISICEHKGLITSESVPRYNNYAVYIVSGTGAGQLRYIDAAKSVRNDKDGSVIIDYPLASYEQPWQVLPDETSKFTLIAPTKNLTLYEYEAEDCVGSVCLYGNVFDAVVSDCTLKDTAGIYLYESNTGCSRVTGTDGSVTYVNNGRITPNANVLIQRNYITGVGANYNVGSDSAQGRGGIFIETQRNDATILAMGNAAVVVRGNTLKDCLPDETTDSTHNPPIGFSMRTQGAKSASAAEADLRYVVFENNVIDGAETGVYAEARLSGLLLRNNEIKNINSEKTYNIVAEKTRYTQSATYILKNGDETTYIDVAKGDDLPEATANGKKFVGWKNAADAQSALYTTAFSDTPVTLTAAYVDKAILKYASLSLEDAIGLNIGAYVDDVLSDPSTKITITRGGTTENISYDHIDEKGYYVYRVYFAPKDYTETVIFKIESGGETLALRELSVESYIEQVLADETLSASHELVRSLQTYCEAAKAYFSGKAVAAPSDAQTEDAKQIVSTYGEKYDFSAETSATPRIISLVLQSQTKQRVYYKNDGGAAICLVDGKEVASYETSDKVLRYIEIENICAKDANKKHTVTIGNATFDVSPYDYVKRIFDKDDDVRLTSLMTAFVRYTASANEYFSK